MKRLFSFIFLALSFRASAFADIGVRLAELTGNFPADGRHYVLAVFVKDADCAMDKCEELIAEIARLCHQYYTN